MVSAIFLESKVLFVFLIIPIFIYKLFVHSVLSDYYLILRNSSNLPDETKVKFRVAFYKVQLCTILSFIGIMVLKNEPWLFNFDDYKIVASHIPTKIKFYYIFESCYYLNELFTMFVEPKKKDFYQMVLHHLITLLLMKLSFNTRFYKFGAAIMILHDVSDPFLELAKVENYLKNVIFPDIIFLMFTCVFFGARLIIFPKFFVWNILRNFKSLGMSFDLVVIWTLLLFLQVLHILWSIYIFALLIKLFKGAPMKDNRE